MTRYPLRNLRLRPGEEHRETVAIELEPFALGGQSYVPSPPVAEATIIVQRATSGDVFQLGFTATLEGPCMRCLADAEVTIRADATEYQDASSSAGPELRTEYVEASSSAGPELRTEYVEASDLLLTAWARDQIGFALPEQILCRPDCQGLCGVCGKNLNLEPHEHESLGGDPRWAALEKLRVDD